MFLDEAMNFFYVLFFLHSFSFFDFLFRFNHEFSELRRVTLIKDRVLPLINLQVFFCDLIFAKFHFLDLKILFEIILLNLS
jgi:hypothetical protein